MYRAGVTTALIPVKTVLVATTLTAEQSGATIVASVASGSTGYAITLPAMASGNWSFRVFSGIAWTGTALTVEAAAADADKIVGQIYSSAGADEEGEVTLGAGADKVTFVASTAVVSDSLDIFTDGTAIYARGFCNATGGLTFDG